MKPSDVLLEILRSEGVGHVFGNPGTTELPLIDALGEIDDIEYVLALQEATVVAMADGYAQVTHRPAFVNLHTSAGLGNGIGNLTNAQANGTPLVVTAGQQDRRHLVDDPLLSGDLVGLARPVSKWAHEVRTSAELGTVMRRAFNDAAAPPQGPVFVSIPMDILGEEATGGAPPRSTVDHRTVAAELDQLAGLLAEPAPGQVAIVAGDEVSTSGAHSALVEVAEALGSPVHGAPLHSTAVFPQGHPLWSGSLPASAAGIRKVLAGYQRVLVVGGRAFMVYPYTPGSPVPDGVELLHLAPDPAPLGRAHPVRLGVVGDPAATLAPLADKVRALVDTPAVGRFLAAAGEERGRQIAALDAEARSRYDASPMNPMAAAHALLTALPPETPVVDEAITTGSYVRGFHMPARPDRYFFCRGGGLGWGMPAAAGVSLGLDRHPVLCVVGDGSAMYSPQALWTAARERLPVVFAVVNNRQYLILKRYLRSQRSPGDEDRFVGLDLDRPTIDYVALARSMGVEATLVERAGDVGDALRQALDTGEPHLIELPISG
jgi:benzoylformate decarboxylase